MSHMQTDPTISVAAVVCLRLMSPYPYLSCVLQVSILNVVVEECLRFEHAPAGVTLPHGGGDALLRLLRRTEKIQRRMEGTRQREDVRRRELREEELNGNGQDSRRMQST